MKQIRLRDEERAWIRAQLFRNDLSNSRRIIGEFLLLLDSEANIPPLGAQELASKLNVTTGRVSSMRKRLDKQGVRGLMQPRRPSKRKLTPEQHQTLIELSQSKPPDGHHRWSNRLLALELERIGYVESITGETVRRLLDEYGIKLGDALSADTNSGDQRSNESET